MMRTHTCGELRTTHIGATVTLAGWVHRRRDHGGIIFIDLRDRYGLTQVTFDAQHADGVGKDAWEKADALRNEWVVQVTGTVVARPDAMINDKMATGAIEVEAARLVILNAAQTPPFELENMHGADVNENLRLQYRYVDLRRAPMQAMLARRDAYIRYMRDYMHERGFTEVQTPILANASPEGARDFLVPSRLYPGKCYALPQAPQQFKQLLMVGGLDRYFQIAPCFRDEDPRADRHYGEFYQMDMEMSFVEQEDVFDVIEPLAKALTAEFSDKTLFALADDERFVRLSWRDAMTTYGSDKPDLRFDLPIVPVTEMVADCAFGVFADAVANGGVVHALKVDGGAQFSRKEIDDLTEMAQSKGAKGLAYIIVKDDGALQSPIVKFLGDALAQALVAKVGAQAGDIVFFGADTWQTVCDALGVVRDVCGAKLGLKDDTKAAWCWIVDFPMYERADDGTVDFSHNPFSLPQGGLEALEKSDPLDILGQQYDLVLNGFEALSGAIRNHDPEIMYKAFGIAGYTRAEVDARFGAMIRAFAYGAPPHGGSAIGIDRLFMVLQDIASIRDVYAFPKDGTGRDLMMDSPSVISKEQLRDVHLRTNTTI